MHKGLNRACAAEPHDVQATFKVVCHMSYDLPTSRAEAAKNLAEWLKGHAYWWDAQ